ncbi:hypothetical protein BGX38DRAFT_1172938 [Terfezia claveryi]|nr:hypothetical protein BGX38DRAFT_1172938 [Terfezia claveryi]
MAPRNLAYRRGYVSGGTRAPEPKVQGFKIRLRATYLSVIGGAAYLGYSIYDRRHPNDLFEPDPSKKILLFSAVDGEVCLG